MHWHEVDGYPWCLIDTPETGPYLSLTLGYGLVHEPITKFGTLQLLAGMLEAELSRPVETSPGRASVPEVSVHMGSDATAVGLLGDVETLRAAWQRLAEVFSGRQSLEAAQPVGVNISAAPRDLTTRFGVTSLTLATSQVLEVESERDPVGLLRYLNPGAGNVRAVMCTNTADLMTGVFPPPAGGGPGAEPSRYRAEARAGGMEFPPGYALVSTVVPRSADGSAAVRVLAQQAAQQLGDLTPRDPGVTVSLVPVGPDLLATIMTAETIVTSEQRSQLHDRIASRPIPDHRIENVVAWEVENRSLNAALERRVHGLADELASVAATQQVLAQARRTLRFFTDRGSVIPAGYGPVQAELPSPDGQRFKTKAWRDSLIIGTEVLEHRREGSKGIPPECDRVDLRHLVLVIDDPQDCVVLIDQEYRSVEVIFDTYRKESQLRDRIAQLTAGVPRITARNAVLAGPMRQHIKNARALRRGLILAPIGVVLFAVFMSWIDDYPKVGEPAPEHVEPSVEPEREPDVVHSAVGETATLPNWSRVTVHSVAEQPVPADSGFPADIGTYFVVDVEYCAAEADDALEPEQFRMLVGELAQLAHGVEEVDDRLESRELAAGQCATGNLGFYIAGEDLTELKVDYRSGDTGSLTWLVEDTE